MALTEKLGIIWPKKTLRKNVWLGTREYKWILFHHKFIYLSPGVYRRLKNYLKAALSSSFLERPDSYWISVTYQKVSKTCIIFNSVQTSNKLGTLRTYRILALQFQFTKLYTLKRKGKEKCQQLTAITLLSGKCLFEQLIFNIFEELPQ